MKSAEKIREQVSEAYTKAVEGECCSPAEAKKDEDQPCCGWATSATMPTPSKTSQGSCGCESENTNTRDVTSECAGYSDDILNDLPSSAVENSLGCGNPVAFSEVQPGEVVVDLGSGAGIDLLIAAKKVGPTGRVIGVDMTDAMIERARANIAEAGVSDYVEVRKGIIEALPIEDNSVDWVISNCVINLSPEKERVFAEIARVLKPGGRMLVSDIVATEIPQAIRDHAAAHSACLSGAISESAYLTALAKAGLVEAEVRGRIRYTPEQVIAFATSECCNSDVPIDDGADRQQLACELSEKIWSANVFARKTGG